MIQIQLMGGLGNQLFQLFTLLAYARRCNASALVGIADESVLTAGRSRPTYWTTLLSALRPLLTSRRIGQQDGREFFFYRESSFDYRAIPLIAPSELDTKDLLLNGYFQSYLYFQRYRFELLQQLRIPDQQAIYCLPPCAAVGADDDERVVRVSMHFRRGDYLAKPDYHPVLTEEYYVTCLTALLNALSSPASVHVFCFCEEESRAEVASMLSTIARVVAAGGSRGSKTILYRLVGSSEDDVAEDWQQLLWMSACDHHILANSSFSWWGAYLSPRYMEADHKVYYPRPWFGPAFVDGTTEKLCPSHWIAVSAAPAAAEMQLVV